jgi:hypothetical protein
VFAFTCSWGLGVQLRGQGFRFVKMCCSHDFLYVSFSFFVLLSLFLLLALQLFSLLFSELQFQRGQIRNGSGWRWWPWA